ADLLSRCPWVNADALAHRYEHAIEVQLPFLQLLYDARISLLPIAMKHYDPDECVALGEALADTLRGANAVVIASSDFSHYVPAAYARLQDAYALEAVERLDPLEFFQRVVERQISACGYGPIAAMLAAARALGARRAKTLAYTTSGDITGDQTQVVGYAAVTVTR
ncbi:MAG: AmmeMemoRadiSam system protein B, partial [Armatimonadota bacterium]|nr:AmmeMemoRadiSam system protein B [Armatimonadota bacterium]